MQRQKRRRSEAKERFWQEQIEHWRTSGQSVRAYCSAQGLTEQSFYNWRRKLGHLKSPRPQVAGGIAADSSASARPAWVQLQLAPAAARSALIEIELTGGTRVRLRGDVSRQTLSDVLALLEARSC